LIADTATLSVEQCVGIALNLLRERGILRST
jgi:hypothetical protein